VTLYDVNTLLYVYKQSIMSMHAIYAKWYAMYLLYMFPLVRHNTTKLCVILLNTKVRLHTMLYKK